MKFFNIFLQVKVQMALFLCLIALTAILHEHFPFSVGYVVLAVMSTVLADWLFIRLRKIKPFLLSASVVTGFIIGLLYSPTLPWYGVVLTAVIAMAAKNFIRYKNRHIFNPAALGLFTTAIVFQQAVSWWGVSFQSFGLDIFSLFLVLILLSPGYVSMIHMKRYRITLGFLGMLVLGMLGSLGLLGGNVGVDIFKATVFDPTTLFFALVMLPEPMTSPNKPWRQVLFGIVVGLLAVGVGFLPLPFLPDPLIAALLVGNLAFFRFR